MAVKKWGFDVDGVLANFVDAFNAKIIEVTGRDLFLPSDYNSNPPAWNWFDKDHAGYTDKEVGAAWKAVTDDPNFWFMLKPLPGLAALIEQRYELRKDHVYFVTARAGLPKSITEQWLAFYGEFINPTVIMSKEKGLVSRALALDVFVEDNLPNAIDVAVESPATRIYLIDRHYNQGEVGGVIRVNSVADMFEREGL